MIVIFKHSILSIYTITTILFIKNEKFHIDTNDTFYATVMQKQSFDPINHWSIWLFYHNLTQYLSFSTFGYPPKSKLTQEKPRATLEVILVECSVFNLSLSGLYLPRFRSVFLHLTVLRIVDFVFSFFSIVEKEHLHFQFKKKNREKSSEAKTKKNSRIRVFSYLSL